MAAATPIFIADAPLGRLVTWLRLLGHDTVYAPELEPVPLCRRALAEGRIVLTRNTRLASHPPPPRCVLVTDDEFRAQLRQVIDACHLTAAPAFLRRCARCNTPLDALPRDAARARVPPYVWATQPCFAHCPSCDRVYWPATHVERMRREIVSLGLTNG
jgi:uncharacterized protein with PIN domain